MNGKSINLSVALTLTFLLFVWWTPQKLSAQNAAPNVSQIVREATENDQRANYELISNYAYKIRRTTVKRNGESESSTYEIYFPSRLKREKSTRGVAILVEKDGVPLKTKKIEESRRDAAEDLEKSGGESEEKSESLENRRAKGLTVNWQQANTAVGLWAFLKNCDFDKPQQTAVDGREQISLRFRNCRMDELPAEHGYMGNLAGILYIDEVDKAVVRLEAWNKFIVNDGNSAPPKPALVFAQKNVAEGLWLPDLISVEGIGNENIFPKLKVNWKNELFDYKLSTTEVTDVEVGKPATR